MSSPKFIAISYLTFIICISNFFKNQFFNFFFCSWYGKIYKTIK